jgi:hypothetical protein
VYTFPAGNYGSGTVNVVFPDDASPQAQASIVVTNADGGQFRRDKLPAGSTRVHTMGPYTDIASIRNAGPSPIDLSLSW